ncbi:MAG TPA: hypothetical protein VM223_23345 [Planctomycetota bacterium]|nr:hypothetical protein [Planctomycetota bacterium]
MQERPKRPDIRNSTRMPRPARLRFAGRGKAAARKQTSATPHMIGIAAIAGALFLFAVFLNNRNSEAPDLKTPTEAPAPKTTRRRGGVEADSQVYQPPPPANLCTEGKQADELFSKATGIVSDWRKTGSPERLKEAGRVLEQAVEMYRKAAKAMPGDRYVERKVNQANQLYYMVMKSSSM